jgi:HAE1 family hydrophobic/amphiphilic exporter-1
MMQVRRSSSRNPAALSMLYVQAPGGKLVPLSAVVTTRQTVGPQSINHIGQLPSVTLSFKPAAWRRARRRAGAACRNARRRCRPRRGHAAGHRAGVRGVDARPRLDPRPRDLRESTSCWDPLRELHPPAHDSLGAAVAGFGALLTLLIFKADLDIYAFVGIIMLGRPGQEERHHDDRLRYRASQGKRDISPADAIYEACMVRFRPIMMTTMAALMGTLPIALGWGAGAEARRPLGLAVVGGLLVSQTLTLYVTPVFYIYMERLQERLARRKAKPALVPSSRGSSRSARSGKSMRRLAIADCRSKNRQPAIVNRSSASVTCDCVLLILRIEIQLLVAEETSTPPC